MKWVLALFDFTPLLFGSPQTHPSIAPGAKETSAQSLHSLLGQDAKVLVIDVRAPKEYYESHIPQTLSIPIERLPKMIRQLRVPKDTMIVTVCDHGGRSSHAVLEIQKMGYKTSSFCRLDSWKKDGYDLQKPESK